MVSIEASCDSLSQTHSHTICATLPLPFAGHCKRLAPAWGDLGQSLAKDDDVVIAHVDCTKAKSTCSSAQVAVLNTSQLFQQQVVMLSPCGLQQHSALTCKNYMSRCLQSSGDKEQCNLSMQIAGYPTLKLFYDGEAQDTYRGELLCGAVVCVVFELAIALCRGLPELLLQLVPCVLGCTAPCCACHAGGRDLASMQDYLKQQKLSLLQETSA